MKVRAVDNTILFLNFKIIIPIIINPNLCSNDKKKSKLMILSKTLMNITNNVMNKNFEDLHKRWGKTQIEELYKCQYELVEIIRHHHKFVSKISYHKTLNDLQKGNEVLLSLKQLSQQECPNDLKLLFKYFQSGKL